MKRILLMMVLSALVFSGCSKDDEGVSSSVQNAINAIQNKSTAKDLIITGELSQNDWVILKKVREQLPSVENITLSDATVIKSGVFSFNEDIAWVQNIWLKKITAPKATKIEANALRFCVELTTADFALVEIIEREAFAVCESLKTLNIPMAKEIGGEAFVACESLTSLSFPLLLNVSSRMFSGCRSLETLEFTKANTIEIDPFSNCSLLKNLKFGCTDAISLNDNSELGIDTKNINLYLNGTEANQAIGKVWKGKTWASISSYDGVAIPDPDFGVANFGCTKDFIIQNETGRPVSGGVIYEGSKGSAWWYIYNFDANDKFISGTIDHSFQFAGTPTEWVFLPIRQYVDELNQLKNKFGNPTSASEDVFSFNMTDKTAKPGYAWYEAQSVMNGGKQFTYKFSNSTTNVESVLSFYLRKGQYHPWGFTIRTTYSQK